MARLACAFALLAPLAAAPPARADDLPPGAIARLGDTRFRAGGPIHQLAMSPDGKRYAAVTGGRTYGALAITEWDAITGRPIREQEVNADLFRGIAWSKAGAFAVAIRAEAGRKEGDGGTLFLGDFCVWDFTDPKAAGPPVLPVGIPGFGEGGLVRGVDHINASRRGDGAEYAGFSLSPGGRYAAALWKSAGDKRRAVHVLELKLTGSATRRKRLGELELGAEAVDGVQLSSDGKTAVTFRTLENYGEMTATVWDVATGRPRRPLRVPATECPILTPDARALVVNAADGEEWGFDLLELPTGKRQKLTRWRHTAEQLDEQNWPAEAGAFAFTPDGRELVVSVDGKVIVIDVARGKEMGRLEGHPYGPVAVAVSADGTSIATGYSSGLVRLWDANTLRPSDELPGHRAPVEHAELSPDGKRLLTWADDDTVRLWDLATGKELRAFAGAPALPAYDRHGDTWPSVCFNAPTFTPDGTAVLYGTKRKLIARDLQTGLETPLPGEMAKLESRFAVVSPDGKAVMTWASDGGLLKACEVWDWPGGKKRFALDESPPREVHAPGFSPNGSAVFIDARSPKRWDAKTGKELPPAWKEDRTASVHPLLSLGSNLRWLLHDGGEAGLRIIEAGTDKVVPRFRLERHGDGPDGEGSKLYGSWGITLSPAGGQFAVALGIEPGDVFLCEAATGLVRRELRGHRGEARVLGFTPDGTKLLTAGGDHAVLVWDVRLQSVPLPEAVKKETSAAKLWNTLATGGAKDAYLAMARMARDPEAAVKMAAMKLAPATKADPGTDATRLADARAVELLDALGTDAACALLKELAAGHAGAFRTQEAKRALERNSR